MVTQPRDHAEGALDLRSRIVDEGTAGQQVDGQLDVAPRLDLVLLCRAFARLVVDDPQMAAVQGTVHAVDATVERTSGARRPSATATGASASPKVSSKRHG